MPSVTAIAKCPGLIFVRPRFDVYREISAAIHAIFKHYSDLVEGVALDEAYLDVTENKQNITYASIIARHIKTAIVQSTQLTATAGVSINKFKSKNGIRTEQTEWTNGYLAPGCDRLCRASAN